MTGLLVVALDTATPRVSAALCRVQPDGRGGRTVDVLGRWAADEPQRHGELAAVAVAEVLRGAGRRPRDLDALVVGRGPGPFTGLRVGLATAGALGHALDVPVHGVVTLDALARPSTTVCTDARRREVYAAGYDSTGARREDPEVLTPAALAARLPAGARVLLGPGASAHGDLLLAEGMDVVPGPEVLPVERLVDRLVEDLLSRRAPEPVLPLYLRRPDAAPLAAPARTTG